jgi:hypothetical protein
MTAEASKAPWWSVLGVGSENPAREFVEARYAALAREHHPDRGGDPVRMATINAAMEEFRRERGR